MNSKRFYIPRQLYDRLKEERTGDTDPWWKDGPTLADQEKLAKNLIDQGALHRCVYINCDFVDVDGLNHRSGLYGTACVIPFENVSGYQVISLFDLNGTELIIEGSIAVSVDGYNTPMYSVNKYVEAYGIGCVQQVKQDEEPKKVITKLDLLGLSAEKKSLRDAEYLATFMRTTKTATLEEAANHVKKMADELNVFHQIKEVSPKFNDVYDLLVMALEGQFGNMPQGTKHDVNDPDRDTVTKTINQSHEDFSATDSHFIAKMVSEIREGIELT